MTAKRKLCCIRIEQALWEDLTRLYEEMQARSWPYENWEAERPRSVSDLIRKICLTAVQQPYPDHAPTRKDPKAC